MGRYMKDIELIKKYDTHNFLFCQKTIIYGIDIIISFIIIETIVITHFRHSRLIPYSSSNKTLSKYVIHELVHNLPGLT